MWRVERLVCHDFIPDPLGPSARSRTKVTLYIACAIVRLLRVKFGAMKIIPSDHLHQEYLTINLGITSDLQQRSCC